MGREVSLQNDSAYFLMQYWFTKNAYEELLADRDNWKKLAENLKRWIMANHPPSGHLEDCPAKFSFEDCICGITQIRFDYQSCIMDQIYYKQDDTE